MPRFSKNSVVLEIQGRIVRAPEGRQVISGDCCKGAEKGLNRGAVGALRAILEEVSAQTRLSRKNMGAILQAQVDKTQKIWGFDPSNGYYQVQARRGDPSMWEAYGYYRACLYLASALEIPLYQEGTDMIPSRKSGTLRYVPRMVRS